MTESTQDIEQLRRRFDDLNQKRIRTDANLQNARKRLEELQQRAREEFGTDNLEELQTKLAEMKIENEKRRVDYQASLDRIEQELAKIESDYTEAQDDDF